MYPLLHTHFEPFTGAVEIDSINFSQSAFGSAAEIPYLTQANLVIYFMPFKAMKELAQAMARQAAEQDFMK